LRRPDGTLQRNSWEFRRFNAELLAISVDGAWCHLAFAQNRRLHFPLLADFEPKGQTARLYGVYRADDGMSARALFVGVNPGADGILRALESLNSEEGNV
jgi:peroxiredoxin